VPQEGEERGHAAAHDGDVALDDGEDGDVDVVVWLKGSVGVVVVGMTGWGDGGWWA
jgi:hypothetical protein